MFAKSLGSVITCVVLSLSIGFSTGCSSQKSKTVGQPVSPKMPSQSRDGAPAAQPASFEPYPVLEAKDILAPELFKGDHHAVDDEVYTFGFMNTYVMNTDFDTYEVIGDEMLRIRVQEMPAMAALEEVSKTKEFAKSTGRAAKGPFVAAKNLILHPVDTISGVPKGMWQYMTRIGEMTRGKRGEFEESVAKELINFSAFKRRIAYQLNVDVYSSNKELQKRLNSVSWATYAGGMTVTVAMFYIPGPAGIIVRGTDATRRLNLIMRDKAPENLRRYNRRLLVEAGFDKDLARQFTEHRLLSPRHKTFIVDALVGMENVEYREIFLQAAMTAASEEDALIFQRVAEMMRGYHDRQAPLRQIVDVDGFPMACTTDNKLVGFMVWDYVVWSKAAADAMGDFAAYTMEEASIEQREIWITGRLSPRAREELSALGVTLHENSFPKLQPPPEPETE
jgi:hypothetical protein